MFLKFVYLSRHHLFRPGAQSGELRPAQCCGHHLLRDRLYHAHRSALELVFPVVAVDTTVVILTAIFFLGVILYAIKAQLSKVKTGREGLVGEAGVVRTDLAPTGKVFVHGELWDASSEEPILAGERVLVVALEGMTVKVEKAGGA